MQHGGKSDLLIEKAIFGRIPNAENRAKICRAIAEILWYILYEYRPKHGGARLTTLQSGNANSLVRPKPRTGIIISLFKT